MVVAVNARFLVKDGMEGMGHFTWEVFQRVAQKHPEHQFYFLFDRPDAEELITGSNMHAIIVRPPARHPLLWRWWFDVAVPWQLRNIKANVFVSADGFCSLTTAVPQVMVVHDLGFLHHPEWYKRGHAFFYRTHMPRFLKKAKVIATVSHFTKHDLEKQYGYIKKEIIILPNGARSIFKPLSITQKVHVKEKFTEGREYFIYTGAIHPRKNLISLLKAFSIFKKRQRSNWKLVLAGRTAWKTDSFLQLLKTYKYKDDVVLTGYVPEDQVGQLMGAAYALVYPSLFEGFGVPVLEAMQSGVPVLTTAGSAMQEVAGDAALYFNPAEPASVAESLMRVYKDEHLRSRLVAQGLERVTSFNWNDTADNMWNCIEKAVVDT